VASAVRRPLDQRARLLRGGKARPLATHLEWLRSKGYGSAKCYLPHDGEHRDAVTAIRFEDHIASAGFAVETIPNQGKQAAMKRVEALRRIFPALRFNEATTQAGVDALGWYHAKIDDKRNVDLGPEHDWSSHGADAAGLMAVAYELPKVKRNSNNPPPRRGSAMAA
jgi:phage terminase large subunit